MNELRKLYRKYGFTDEKLMKHAQSLPRLMLFIIVVGGGSAAVIWIFLPPFPSDGWGYGAAIGLPALYLLSRFGRACQFYIQRCRKSFSTKTV